MNENVVKAEKWLARMGNLAAGLDKEEDLKNVQEHMKILSWLIQQTKTVEELRKEKEHYKLALHRVVFEEIKGWTNDSVLGKVKVIEIASSALEKYRKVESIKDKEAVS